MREGKKGDKETQITTYWSQLNALKKWDAPLECSIVMMVMSGGNVPVGVTVPNHYLLFSSRPSSSRVEKKAPRAQEPCLLLLVITFPQPTEYVAQGEYSVKFTERRNINSYEARGREMS